MTSTIFAFNFDVGLGDLALGGKVVLTYFWREDVIYTVRVTRCVSTIVEFYAFCVSPAKAII